MAYPAVAVTALALRPAYYYQPSSNHPRPSPPGRFKETDPVRRILGPALVFLVAGCAKKVQAPTVQTAMVTRRDVIVDAQANGVIAAATGSVSGGTTIVQMADLSTVRVRALFNETDFGIVRPGEPANVTVDA